MAHLPVRAARDEQPKPYSSRQFSPMQSLLASAVRINHRKVKRVRHEKWQSEAWDLRDILGEVRFPALAISRAMSRAHIYIGKVSKEDPLAEPEPLEDATSLPFEVFNALGGGSRAGRSQLLQRIGEQLLIVGESYLVGVPPADAGNDVALRDLRWEAVSADEVDSMSGGSTGGRKQAALVDEEGNSLDNVQLMVRIWQPHPRRWWEADSPVRSSLPVLRELVGLTQHVSAQIDQRLAGAGILAISQGASAVIGSEGEEVELIDAIVEATVTPIENREAASALVPLILEVNGKASDAMHHVRFWSELDKEARPLREEAITRWSLGADIPPELLLGMSTGNHWTAWLIREETVTTHIEPHLALICDALTSQYLWPILEEANVQDAQDYVIWYDASPLTQRPNRADTAAVLHEREVISDAALRRESGFDETDAPPQLDPNERALNIVMGMVTSAPTLIREIGIPELVAQVRAVMSGIPEEDGDRTEEPDLDDPEAVEVPEEDGPPDTLPDEPVDTDDEPDGLPASANGRVR